MKSPPQAFFYWNYIYSMSRLEKYVKATAAEMNHVSWPTRQQALV
jgi:preprotein translocase subunit SecE